MATTRSVASSLIEYNMLTMAADSMCSEVRLPLLSHCVLAEERLPMLVSSYGG
jgi:hypothetical protein